MAKDPAFLFYPNDYIGGTMGMTLEEKGAYIELLMMQFNRGHMTSHMIGQAIGQLWDTVKVKFVQDKDGLWYNERLDSEKEKRKSFVNSRNNNLLGSNQYSKKKKNKSGHMSGRMTSHTENEIENEDESETVKEKEKKKKYGEYKHVLLTDSQHEKLISENGQEVAELAIKILDEGIEAKGYKYKNHYLVILKWPLENAKKQLLKNNELTLDQIFEDAREETRRRSEGKI